MAEQHILARLTPRARQIDGMPFGGKARFSWAEIAGSLAGLSSAAADVVHYWHGVPGSALRKHLEQIAILIVKADALPFADPSITVPRMTGLAIEEHFNPITCPNCNGNEWLAHECERCRGTGRVQRNASQRALCLCIHRTSWGKSHDALLARLLAEIGSLEREVIRHVRHQLELDEVA